MCPFCTSGGAISQLELNPAPGAPAVIKGRLVTLARLAVCIILDRHQSITSQNSVLANNSLDNSTVCSLFRSLLAKIECVYLTNIKPTTLHKYLLHFQSSLSTYFIQMA